MWTSYLWLSLTWLLVSTAGSSQSTGCHVDYKVYVYPLPSTLLQRGEEARRNQTFHICQKCIFEQFALEYIVLDYFTQFCGRTVNPEEADFFYLPIIRDLDYRIALTSGGGRAPSPTEQALLGVLEKRDFSLWTTVFNVTSKYFERHHGADHILVMPAPVTNFRHQSNMRGFFHYMPQLASPIFFNVEYSRSFVQEYPICAKEKNLVMPYPTTDAALFSKSYFDGHDHFPHHSRSKLIFYHGGYHGSCIFIREALNQLSHSKEYAIQRGDRKREQGFQQATFCPIPVGDSPSSKRMYDALHFGCIPVLLSDDALWAYSLQSGGALDPSSFSLQLPQRLVQKTAQELLLSLQEANKVYLTRLDNDSVVLLPEVNWGKPLPSGQSLYTLLEQVAREEAAEDQTTTDEESAPDNKQKKPGGKKRSTQNPAMDKNPLIRLLLKISKQDIRSLREQAWNVSSQYRFYAFNTTLTRSSPPLTATHTFPNGGATQQLDRFLSQRKHKGIAETAKQCEVEINSIKHKYVGNYPCQKNRRLLHGEGSSNTTADCGRQLQQDAEVVAEQEVEASFWKEVEAEQHHAAWNQL